MKNIISKLTAAFAAACCLLFCAEPSAFTAKCATYAVREMPYWNIKMANEPNKQIDKASMQAGKYYIQKSHIVPWITEYDYDLIYIEEIIEREEIIGTSRTAVCTKPGYSGFFRLNLEYGTFYEVPEGANYQIFEPDPMLDFTYY